MQNLYKNFRETVRIFLYNYTTKTPADKSAGFEYIHPVNGDHSFLADRCRSSSSI